VDGFPEMLQAVEMLSLLDTVGCPVTDGFKKTLRAAETLG